MLRDVVEERPNVCEGSDRASANRRCLARFPGKSRVSRVEQTTGRTRAQSLVGARPALLGCLHQVQTREQPLPCPPQARAG